MPEEIFLKILFLRDVCCTFVLLIAEDVQLLQRHCEWNWWLLCRWRELQTLVLRAGRVLPDRRGGGVYAVWHHSRLTV